MALYANLANLLAEALKTDQDRDFSGISVRIRSSDGYVNLSALARACGSRFGDYLANKKTKEFLEALKEEIPLPENRMWEPIEQCGTNRGSFNYWGHVLVAIDLCSWASTTIKIQFLSWILVLLSTGSVRIDTPSAPVDVLALVEQQIAALRMEIAEKDATLATQAITLSAQDKTISQLERSLNIERIQRRRPKLPNGSGVYIGYTDASPDRCMVGKFERDPVSRWNGYHTHSLTPFKYAALLYTRNNDLIETMILRQLDYLRPNTNEVIMVTPARATEMLQKALEFLSAMGDTGSMLLTEDTSPELAEFNASTQDRDISVTADLEPAPILQEPAEPMPALQQPAEPVPQQLVEPAQAPQHSTEPAPVLQQPETRYVCPCGKVCNNTRGLFNHRRECAKAQASEDLVRLSQLSGKSTKTAQHERDEILKRISAATAEPVAPELSTGVRCPCGQVFPDSRSVFNHRRFCESAQASSDLERLSELSGIYTIKANVERAEILERLAAPAGALATAQAVPSAVCVCGFEYRPHCKRRHPKMHEGCIEFKNTQEYIAYAKAIALLRSKKCRALKKR